MYCMCSCWRPLPPFCLTEKFVSVSGSFCIFFRTGSNSRCVSLCVCQTGGLFPTGSHEYEVFRFALAQHQDIPKLVPQVDMVDTGSSFAMTYACKSHYLTLMQDVNLSKAS